MFGRAVRFVVRSWSQQGAEGSVAYKAVQETGVLIAQYLRPWGHILSGESLIDGGILGVLEGDIVDC